MKNFIKGLLILTLVFSGGNVHAVTKTPAKDITVDATVFTRNLNATDTDVQKALVTLDQLTASGAPGGVNTQVQINNLGSFGGGNMYSVSGNIGVGSTSPGTNLDVSGSIRSTSLTASKCVQTDSNGILTSAAAACGSGGSSQWITYGQAGNVGIGTTDRVGIGTTLGSAGLTVMNGNVGIGTWNPRQALEITGQTLHSTNVGIGTTVTKALLHVGAGGDAPSATTPAGYFTSNGTTNVAVRDSTNDTELDLTVSAAQIRIASGTANSDTLIVGPNSSLAIQNGNVGIGTVLPIGALDILENSSLTDNTEMAGRVRIFNINTTDNTYAQFVMGAKDAGNVIRRGIMLDAVTTDHSSNAISTDLAIITSNAGTSTEKVRLTSAGNFGIGTTSPRGKLIVSGGNVGIGTLDPGTTLDITGTVRASTDIKIGTQSVCQANGTNCPASAGTNYWNLVASAGNVGITTANTVGIGTTSGSAGLAVMNGNVGIGTWNPVQALEVNGTSQITGFKLTTNPSAGYVLTSNTVGVGTWMPASSGGSGTINSGTTNRAAYYSGATTLDSSTKIFNDNNNVGIGTINPRTSVEIGAQTMNINGANVGIGSISPIGKLDIRPSNTVFVGCSDSLSTAITNATAGDTLLLGSCTYSISSGLTIAKSLRIKGLGINQTVIATGVNNISAFTITSDNVTLQDMKITGTNPAEPYVSIDASATTTFTNVNLYNVWVSITESTCTQIITYYDAGGTVESSRVDGVCSGASAQIIGLIAKYYSTNEATTTIRVNKSIFDISDTDGSFSGQVRGVMHWHNSASVSPSDTNMIVTNTLATCYLTVGGGDTECLQNQGPNAAGNPGVTGVDYTYVYNSTFDGTTKCYSGFASTKCRDYRIDDYANTSLFNVTLGTNQISTQNSATINRFGSIATSAIVGTQPQQAASSLVGQNLIDLTGQKGGDTPGTGSQTGKTGGNSSLIAGAGGTATAATTTATAGPGGAHTITAGAGGAETISSSTTNVGGVGGAITLTTGAGGAASAAATTNTGGVGGDVTIDTGAGGVGTSTTGRNGVIIFKNATTEKMRLDNNSLIIGSFSSTNTPPASGLAVSGNMGIGTYTAGRALHVYGSSTNNIGIRIQNIGTGGRIYDFLSMGNAGTIGSSGLALLDNTTTATRTFWDANGNVGIATFLPVNKLEVNGSTSIGYADSTTTAPTNGLTVSGNVGIGTITPGAVALDVTGTTRQTGFTLTGNGAASGFILQTSGTLGIGTWVPAPSGGAGTPGGSSPQLQYNNGGSFGGVTATASNGTNIGIGTVDVLNVLDVIGGVGIGTINGTAYTNQPLVGTGVAIQGNVGIGTWKATNSLIIAAGITGGGNVGIGTLFPGTALDANGVIRAAGGSAASPSYVTTTGGNNTGAWSPAANEWAWSTNGIERMRVKSTGNIGIGTSLPAGGLTIIGNVGISTVVSSAYATTAPPSGGLLVEGNIGIGSLAPGAALDVNGTVRSIASGNSYFLGNLGIGTTLNTTSNLTVMQGNVGIGTWKPAQAWTLIGNVGISTTGPSEISPGFDGKGATSCICTQFKSGICISGSCT